MSMSWDGVSMLLALLVAAGSVSAEVSSAKELRLIPFPKSVRLERGSLRLKGRLRVVTGEDPADRFAAEELRRKIRDRTGIEAKIGGGVALDGNEMHTLRLSVAGAPQERIEALPPKKERGNEAYALRVSPAGVLIQSVSSRGLFYGVQTLKQLIRANMVEGAIPCLIIEDWPAFRHRGFQDDITRGPNPKLELLKREVLLGSEVKQNFFTYYMEYQYAFEKHPEIGPEDGSLTPEELRALVRYGEQYHVDIIGNQQSFGHFEDILRHERYAHLRETPSLLCPTKEESYELLDDLYSEQVPLLKSDLFNVCCDETWGLGTGPSKKLAEKIGVGGVYARHMRRVHDLLKEKYGKRMMMWGDIILQHPENLKEIPKDTVMLTWGYDARESFENQIIPFAKSGYEFFVCPGVSCWVWILPDFDVAVTNIRNFVRDGAKHGAMGVLNTTWDDAGENFFNTNWHGVLWGAECAWNASATDISDFNKRFGAVLIGEEGDHLGKAIEALSKTHRLRGYEGMRTGRFWKVAFERAANEAGAVRKEAEELLTLLHTAIDELRSAKADAKVNADIIDYFLFGAERMKLIATRELRLLEVVQGYKRASEEKGGRNETDRLLADATEIVRKIRDEHKAMKARYAKLWQQENKPYALDVILRRFDAVIGVYDRLIEDWRREGGFGERRGVAPGIRTPFLGV